MIDVFFICFFQCEGKYIETILNKKFITYYFWGILGTFTVCYSATII